MEIFMGNNTFFRLFLLVTFSLLLNTTFINCTDADVGQEQQTAKVADQGDSITSDASAKIKNQRHKPSFGFSDYLKKGWNTSKDSAKSLSEKWLGCSKKVSIVPTFCRMHNAFLHDTRHYEVEVHCESAGVLKSRRYALELNSVGCLAELDLNVSVILVNLPPEKFEANDVIKLGAGPDLAFSIPFFFYSGLLWYGGFTYVPFNDGNGSVKIFTAHSFLSLRLGEVIGGSLTPIGPPKIVESLVAAV
jgi:hypothetical protein